MVTFMSGVVLTRVSTPNPRLGPGVGTLTLDSRPRGRLWTGRGPGRTRTVGRRQRVTPRTWSKSASRPSGPRRGDFPLTGSTGRDERGTLGPRGSRGPVGVRLVGPRRKRAFLSRRSLLTCLVTSGPFPSFLGLRDVPVETVLTLYRFEIRITVRIHSSDWKTFSLIGI